MLLDAALFVTFHNFLCTIPTMTLYAISTMMQNKVIVIVVIIVVVYCRAE